MSKREQKRIRDLERRVEVLEEAFLVKYAESNLTDTRAAIESRIKKDVFDGHRTWWARRPPPNVYVTVNEADQTGSDATGSAEPET